MDDLENEPRGRLSKAADLAPAFNPARVAKPTPLEPTPTRSRHRRLVVASATASVLVVVGVVFGLTRSPDSQPASLPGQMTLQEWLGGTPRVGHNVRDEANRVYESFAGSLAERNALQYLRTYYSYAGVDACMTREGYPEWDWKTYLVPVTPEDPLTTTTWFAAPFSRWRSQALLASRTYLINEQAFNNDEGPRTSALQLCNHAANSQLAGTVKPRIKEKLTRRWWNTISSADEGQVPDESLYYQCMDDADITMLKNTGLEIGDVGPAMSAVSPNDQDIPADATDATDWNNPAWQTFLALEDEYFRADWGCRRDVYTEHIDDLRATIEGFRISNADDITRTRSQWEAVLQQAISLGFDPQNLADSRW